METLRRQPLQNGPVQRVICTPNPEINRMGSASSDPKLSYSIRIPFISALGMTIFPATARAGKSYRGQVRRRQIRAVPPPYWKCDPVIQISDNVLILDFNSIRLGLTACAPCGSGISPNCDV
jgi:hypothetical protein